MALKIGSKVILVKHKGDSNANPGLDIGSVGIVAEVLAHRLDKPEEQPYRVEWDDVEHRSWWVCAESIAPLVISLENK